ncbi:YIP1 family protein [Massilia sp. G4R7]|uniref:YIP1 family protein n=1 Tax=Massilia phyllostachyos TaxID=2898585 RepID=A0ABS8Q6K8_9BURK|nr:YIP1 family protein [Massilia phyllostachyos]MCD2516712.1 YIP1 family protein [Massilia phyllostachyos]
MSARFVQFLLLARWGSALVALMYHVRFLAFVNYDAVEDKSLLLTGLYFLTGLGHEAYAVCFILDGMLVGLILRRQRAGPGPGDASLGRHALGLYGLLLPGLLLGAAFDHTGAHLFGDTGVYTAFPEFSTLALGLAVLLGNLLMLQPFVVANFGGNSMLYLLSYLFWSLVLLAVFLRAGQLPQPHRRAARVLLPALAIVFLPYQFLIWSAIWLAGLGLVFLAEGRSWRPPLPATLPLFGAALLLSRFLGPATRGLEAVLRDWVIQFGFLGAGVGFAALVWSVYPKGQDSGTFAAVRASEAWPAQAASFTFFFHFPVIMLLAAWGDARLGQPLMQQPSVAYPWFAGLVLASVLTATGIALTVDSARRAFGNAARLTSGRRGGSPS